VTRTMYDSTGGQAHNIPRGAQMVAGFVDGYAWTQSEWDLFPDAVKVTISVYGNPADVGDVENGALTIQQAIKIGYPSVYCSTYFWAANQAAYRAAGKPQPNWWVAAYPGAGPTVPAGAIAHQYSSDGGYDTSVVADYWPGVDPIPAPPPAPAQNPEDAMSVIVLQPGEPFFVSGPDENAEWNAISAYGEASTIEVIAYNYQTGAPLATTGVLPLAPNVPGKVGPIPAFGGVGSLSPGPCTLGFVPGSGPVTLRLKLVD